MTKEEEIQNLKSQLEEFKKSDAIRNQLHNVPEQKKGLVKHLLKSSTMEQIQKDYGYLFEEQTRGFNAVEKKEKNSQPIQSFVNKNDFNELQEQIKKITVASKPAFTDEEKDLINRYNNNKIFHLGNKAMAAQDVKDFTKAKELVARAKELDKTL